MSASKFKLFFILVFTLSFMCSCNGKRVIDNTYTSLGEYEVEVSKDFLYLGDLQYFQDIYYVGERKPYAKRKVNASIFIRMDSPKQLLYITRWSADTYFSAIKWRSREIDGVSFGSLGCLHGKPSDDVLRYISTKGYNFPTEEPYGLILRKNISRWTQYSIHLYVEKTFQSDDCPKVKEHLCKLMANNIRLKKL